MGPNVPVGGLSSPPSRTLRILGTRGLPAAHGGFETFAEHLALHLVERGWRVVVYCQEDGTGPVAFDVWHGIERVRIPVARPGPPGTIIFDWLATRHAVVQSLADGGLCLTLGYNTAVFCAWMRLRGVRNVINMDGIEWARAKWGPLAKTWFWLNERAGCWLGDHLIADHPEIKNHLSTRTRADRITTIPYGADELTDAPTEPVRSLGLEPGRYLTLIARAEPENSILEVVSGFSRRPRGVRLAVLGRYEESNTYHREVRAAANEAVSFVGAIYDKRVVHALRFHSLAYVHGHQVGGTNPSLVEALGAGNAIIAHDNRFNRWVTGEGAVFFRGAGEFDEQLSALLADPVALRVLQEGSRRRLREEFTWPAVLARYESLLMRWTAS